MKILICCNVYPPNFIGGAELIAHQQALALVKTGHEVQVFTGDTQPIGERHSCREDVYQNLKIYRIYLTGEDYQSDYVNFSHPQVENHFAQVLKQFCPDVIHFHNIIGLSVTIIRVAKEYGAKTILTLHDHWGFCFKNTIMKYDGVTCRDYSQCEECQSVINDGIQRQIPMRLRQNYFKLMMREVDLFVSPSQYLAETYLKAGFSSKKMNVIWNGIDFDRFDAIQRNPHDNKVRFSFFGNFGRHKGVSTLLEALPCLNNRYRVQINLIGNGDQENFYREQLNENGCTYLVKFWGKLDNGQVHRAYAETDVLILPSIWPENQPVSITEAMAAGIPVIASNMGGMPELVEDGKTGLIFEAGNAQDLAEKMDFLIEHPDLIKAFGKTAKERMRNNTFESQANKLLTLYQNKPTAYQENENNLTLILCVGQHFDPKCAAALVLLPHYLDDLPNSVLVMADWITEQQRKTASLIWIVDKQVSIRDIRGLFRLEKPFLVPEQNEDLVYLCRKGDFGLYYRDEHEAAACISYLLRSW